MEGDLGHSPQKKQKMKKAKLSKTVDGKGKASTKETILHRMSSGKKRPRSEPRTRKGGEVQAKGDLLAKKLSFQSFGDGVENDDDGESKKPTGAKKQKLQKGSISSETRPASAKKAAKTKGLATPRGQSASTSKWQVTDSTSKGEKPGKGGSALKKDLAKTKKQNGKQSLKSGHKVDIADDDDDEELDPASKQDELNSDGDDDEDDEIDFPVLKRKSLGPEAKLSGELVVVGKEIPKKGGKEQVLKAKEKVKGKKGKDGASNQQQQAEGGETGQDRKKKKKRRGKKRGRSNSESEEPHAKKDKKGDEFSVRCGNLPVGTSRSDLSMFLGEADIFPNSMIIKSKKKTTSGHKACPVKYATLVCRSAEEADRLCELNGISMPSTVGNRECRLLIHKINADSTNDPSMQFKRKLYLKNLHTKVNEDELLEYFVQNKFNPTNVIFPGRGLAKKSKGTALVWLHSSGDVDRAVGLQNPKLRDQVFTITRSNVSSHAAQEP